MDPSDRSNGCVYYARGTHAQGLWPHAASHVPGNSWGLAEEPDPAGLDEVPGILAPGDAMLHHCCLLHRSEPNRSARPRRGLLMVFRGAHCEVDPVGMEQYLAALEAQKKRMGIG
jgi:ectoine hydroxylase-related dioxygenase (phytanoyl-CoA dioxygenase family)